MICAEANTANTAGGLAEWLLGMVGTYTIGAFVHVLVLVALVLLSRLNFRIVRHRLLGDCPLDHTHATSAVLTSRLAVAL